VQFRGALSAAGPTIHVAPSTEPKSNSKGAMIQRIRNNFRGWWRSVAAQLRASRRLAHLLFRMLFFAEICFFVCLCAIYALDIIWLPKRRRGRSRSVGNSRGVCNSESLSSAWRVPMLLKGSYINVALFTYLSFLLSCPMWSQVEN
jgi:hypothetical protein